jgi:penicillin-binding protein 2
MLIVDQLRKDDARLRVLAMVVLAGMALLAAGLWRLQVLAARRYVRSEESQSVRLVRVPAARGRILDRNGIPLAENRPRYDVQLYLEELRPAFAYEYTNGVLPAFRAGNPGVKASGEQRRQLQEWARLRVYSNTVTRVAQALGTPIEVSAEKFLRHYRQDLALPLAVAENLSPAQMALFFERCLGAPGVDVEAEAVRAYPQGQLAAHALGHLRRVDEAENDPDPLVFRYRLRDFAGVAGIEGHWDEELRGRAGVKALRVNSQGYRHAETILQPTEPGVDVTLTLDVPIQATAERALARVGGAETRGAVVVMDVHTGDLLALVSSPAFDPNQFLGGMSVDEFAYLNDETLRPQMNRAVSGAYPPGSIFKIVVGLAALESGVLDPGASRHYLGYWPMGPHARPIDDLAPPGDYDFKRAFKLSSNAYFIDHGLKAGRGRIVAMARRLGLGEAAGLRLGAETAGFLPDDAHVGRRRSARDPWSDGDTAQLSIGQGAVTVSPLQMAVMTAALANGGRVLEPRLVQRLGAGAESPSGGNLPKLRTEAGVSSAHLNLMREAMRADVEEEGTGREAAVPGMGVCGKTGTAEIKRGRLLVDKVTWFVAFAPFESPRYAVVVMVEGGGSGGRTCAPVARQIFLALQQRERGGGLPTSGPAGPRTAALSGARVLVAAGSPEGRGRP